MSRYPCSGTYTPGGGSGGSGGSGGGSGGGGTGGVNDTVARTCEDGTTVVNSHVYPVATLNYRREGGMIISNDKVLLADKRLYIFGGVDQNGNWLGNSIEVYNPNDGSVTEVTLSTPIPQSSVLLPANWAGTKYPMEHIIYDTVNDRILFFETYNLFGSGAAKIIDPATGNVSTLESVYSNWTNFTGQGQYGVVKFVPDGGSGYGDGLFVLTDGNDGANTDAYFFSFTDNAWYILTFNATYSDDPNAVVFTKNMDYLGGSTTNNWWMYIDDGVNNKVIEFLPYSPYGPPYSEYYFIYRFNGVDPLAVTIDSTGTPFGQQGGAGALISAYARGAIYDSAGNLTDDGDFIALGGGDSQNIDIDEYHRLENFDSGAIDEGSTKITEHCPTAYPMAVVENTFDAEVPTRIPTYPASVDTSSRTDLIYVLYFLGGEDTTNYNFKPAELYAVVLPFKVPTYVF